MLSMERLPGGVVVKLVVPQATRDRLKMTCFRGATRHLAGNFSRWSYSAAVLTDPLVLAQVLPDIDHAYTEKLFETHSFSLDYGSSVGWESTDRRENYAVEDLERFKPNRHSSGLRVKKSSQHLLAPRTNFVTFVYQLKAESDGPVVVFHSMYPGVDIGELDEDVTLRENRVFFDWDHPGAS